MSQNQTERARIKPKDNFFITPSPSGSTQHRTKPPRRPPKPVTTKSDPKPEKRADKQPFDKKKWRLQKYSKKYKLQQWEDRRKKAVLREYYRDVDPHERKFDVQKIYAQMDDEGEASADAVIAKRETSTDAAIAERVPSDTQAECGGVGESKRKSTAKRAHLEFLRIKEEKQRQKEEALKRKQERAEAVKQYKKRKTEIYKKLSKKTKRGQPVMKDRMEVLLERIQNSLNS